MQKPITETIFTCCLTWLCARLCVVFVTHFCTHISRPHCGAWGLSGEFGASPPEGLSFESYSIAATYGPCASPSLAVACSASAC